MSFNARESTQDTGGTGANERRTVLLPDASGVQWRGLVSMIEGESGIRCIHSPARIADLLRVARTACPDVILLPGAMASAPVTELAPLLRSTSPASVVIAISADIEDAMCALLATDIIDAYWLYDDLEIEEVSHALSIRHEGLITSSRRVLVALKESSAVWHGPTSADLCLSARQNRLLNALVRGVSQRTFAMREGKDARTIRLDIEHLRGVFHVGTTQELIAAAALHGFGSE